MSCEVCPSVSKVIEVIVSNGDSIESCKSDQTRKVHVNETADVVLHDVLRKYSTIIILVDQ